ncbi:hypothetical protein FB467_2651 [Ornithinicoccus hortensis]|uniref:Matrixin n=1 Tax=Ornithinicoccus hortensis TaxID=82346 RepID=A0A542YU76_9MICO|nr:hypothetical protein FB467_2651 [Ornithinicoccus hortensis]
MTRQRRRMSTRLAALALLGTLVIPAVASASTVPPSGTPARAPMHSGGNAPNDSLADSSCTWQHNNGNWPAEIRVHIAAGTAPTPYPNYDIVDFPAAVVRDGRTYSFQGRIRDAVSRWDTSLGSTAAGAAGFNYTNGELAFTGTLANDRVVVYHYNPTQRTPADPPLAAGNDYWRTGGVAAHWIWQGRTSSTIPSCTPRITTHTRLLRAAIYVPQYSNWHTAAERSAWENCAARDAAGPYLCRKDYDLQESVHHELGHTLGLVHATGTVPSTWAHCGEPTVDRGSGAAPRYRTSDRSVMCAGPKPFETARRTAAHLHNYESRTISRQGRDQL